MQVKCSEHTKHTVSAKNAVTSTRQEHPYRSTALKGKEACSRERPPRSTQLLVHRLQWKRHDCVLIALMTIGGCFQSSLSYRTMTHASLTEKECPSRQHAGSHHAQLLGDRNQCPGNNSMKQHVMLPSWNCKGKVLQNCTSQIFRAIATRVNPANWASGRTPSTQDLG